MKKLTAITEALLRLFRKIRLVSDRGVLTKVWTIRKYADDAAFMAGTPFAVSTFKQNVLLNEGIAEMWDLIIGAGGTAFSEANSYIGIGDSDTAAAASQTGLQAVTNKYYAAMASTYPSRSGQTVTWRGVVGGSYGNHAWKEFTVANGNSDSAKNMNRKVSDQGTKISGQTWTVDLAITLS
ncbi:MAG: hypothetical protein CVU74_01085 [Deltaproteobacteria bacterium HGW-Deltaproteobacteria-9]|jgi:hypothetical protein|nr:MAG: hypothetical protein CVU74_01085 [Deltaproteobacteria bacterium HGW-Deltaproteobacteria-9]